MNARLISAALLLAATPAWAGSPYAVDGDPERLVDFGDGRHGAFNNGPTQSVPGLSGLTIDASQNTEFQFSSFTLTGVLTITPDPNGSGPIIIRVNGDATISGTIELNGANGTNGDFNGAGSTAVPQGGVAGPGGGKGGVGGVSSVPGAVPTSGQSVGNAKGGGPGSSGLDTFQAGGGGGCNGNTGANGQVDQGTAGAGGQCVSPIQVASLFETAFRGGAGGGGGGVQNINDGDGGAGGGGGGGILIAVRGNLDLSNAIIRANGGAGGNSAPDALGCAGAGGGGAGGSIWIQVAGTVSEPSGVATFEVNAGAAGADICGAYSGGAGTGGVTRIDAGTNQLSFNANAENPISLITDILLSGGFFCGNARITNGVSQDERVEYSSPLGNLFVLLSGLGLAWLLGRLTTTARE